MINLRIFFGFVPKTADYEDAQISLRKEYAELDAFRQSPELEEYNSLQELVNSREFTRRKKEILALRYQGSPEYLREKEYFKLKKNREIRNYFSLKNSVQLKDFLEFDKSFDVKHFQTLEKLVHSTEFEQTRKRLGKNKFAETDEYQKLREYEALKESDRFKEYFEFKRSKSYLGFNLLIGSEKIAAFEKLEQYINSAEFRERKEYLMLNPKQKYALSEEFKKEERYKTLKTSEKIIWYFKTRDSRKFDEIKRWDLTFEDDFNSKKPDTSKWLTRYFWGETLLNDSYSLDNEKQFMNYDKNMTLSDSKLIIITKQERVKGKAWNPTVGFFPRDFEYTSGTLNTGGSFRQQYGLFEAKIRFNRNYPVNHALWLVSDFMLPHIDIAKSAKNVIMGNYWGALTAGLKPEKNIFKVSAAKYASDFYIFSLEWTSTRLTWKINGVPVASVREGVPQVPMYLNLASSLYEKTHEPVFPASFEIDWIRCYKTK